MSSTQSSSVPLGSNAAAPGARAGDRFGSAGQVGFLNLTSQSQKAVEVDADLGPPGVLCLPGVHGGAIQVEVVLVAAHLHEHLELAIGAPAVVAAARPEAKLPVRHEILRAGGKAIISLGAVIEIGRAH